MISVRKILVTGTRVTPEFLEPLSQAGYEVKNPTHLLSEEELRDELADSVAYLLGGKEYVSEAALAKADHLKVIAFLGIGYESFMDVPAARRRNLTITNTPDTLTDPVAEFAIGKMLTIRRQIIDYHNRYREGERGFEVKQRNVRNYPWAIIGLGAIGTRIAEILRLGFGAEVVYYSRTRKPQLEAKLGITYQPLHELVTQVAGIFIATPGNESTRHMVDGNLLDSAQPGTLLINVARPAIVEPEGLRRALESGTIAAAAFDNFYPDPIGSELLDQFGTDRLVVTGHIGSLTHDAGDAMTIKAVDSILNVLNKGTDPHIVG
jgi:lactate dehydrogenase-like 2-hydroxyacid dehydrogenase